MRSDFRDILACIAAVNRQVSAAADQANAMVQEATEELQRLYASGIVRDMTLLGPILRIEGSQPGDIRLNVGWVIRAALKMPGGFGVLTWDVEGYCIAEKSESGVEIACAPFIPFEHCGLALQSLMRPHLEGLLRTLFLRIG